MSLADQASLLLIPSGYRESKIYSVFPTTGVGDFTFNRNSSATRIAKNGLITSVATDIPRLEYPLIDGVVNGCPSLLLEPQRTNLITYSEDFSQNVWIKRGNPIVSLNNILSPQGILNASELKVSFAAVDDIYTSASGFTPSTKFSASFYFKKVTSSGIIVVTAAVSNGSWNLDLSLLGNDWEFISESHPAVTVTTTFESASDGSGGLQFYSSNGTDINFYIYGVQLEEGSYPTSYIKSNSGGTTTRAAETANGAGDAATFSDSEGVLMAEISALANDGTFRVISINGTATNVNTNRIQMYFRDTADIITFGMESENSAQFFLQFPLDVKSNNKLALKYSASSCS